MTDTEREQWLAERRSGIGGSDVAALLGLSPWKTPYDLWLDKRGEGEEVDEDKPAIYWGNVLEEVVAQEYAVRTKQKVQRVNTMMRLPGKPHFLANIDRAVINPNVAGNVRWNGERLTTDRILECKTANGFMTSFWGEAGTDRVPDYYLLQCQWYLGITQASVADLAVLIGGSDYRVYTIERDNQLIADIHEAAQQFWNLVTSGVAPDPQTVADALKRWPRHIASAVKIVDVDVARACEDLAELKASMKAGEKAAEELQLKIVTAFEDFETISHGGKPIATWKAQDTTRVDGKRLKDEKPDIAAEYSKTTSTRVLRLAKQKD